MARNFGGIAQGLATGIQLAQGMQDRKDRKEQNDREYGLRSMEQSSRLARQAVSDERESADYAVKAADDVHKSAVSRMAGIASRYGSFEAAPPEEQARAREEAVAADQATRTARTKRDTVAFGQQRQEYSNLISNLQTGRTKVEDVPPDQLWLAVANATQRDPTDFMTQPDGSPSVISKAVGDVTTGLETGNGGMVVNGANVILAPELRKGVGTESPHGGRIVAKEIDRLIPHPNNPSLVSPVVRVYVDQGPDFKGPRGKHQETSYYLAPLTEGRTSDPNDPVKFIDMKAALDRVGQMGMLTEVMNQPEFRRRMEDGRTQAGDRTKALIDDYFTQGVNAMPKKQLTSTAIKLGDKTLLRTTDPQGREVGREELAHSTKAPRERTFESKLAVIEDMDVSEAEKDEMRKKVVSGIGPVKASAGKGGSRGGAGGGGKITEAEVKGTLKDVERNIAGQLGIQISPTSKKWVDASGKPADPAKVEAFNEAYRKASILVRDNQAGGKKTGASAALSAAGAPAPAAAPAGPAGGDKFTVGQVYRNGKGQQAKYLGNNKWEEVK